MGLLKRYTRVPTSASAASMLPTTSTVSSPSTGFGRARIRWTLILAATVSILVFSFSSSSDATASLKAKAGQYAGQWQSNSWSWGWPWSAAASVGLSSLTDVQGHEFNRWVNGSGRANLKYDSPFNPEDLTLTEDECDTFFPGLYKDLERAAAYYSDPDHLLTKEYLDRVCDDGMWSHARVLVHNNKVYIKYFQQSVFLRINAALGLLDQSVAASREKLPNAEFCLSVNDWGSPGKFSLDRSWDQEDVWLMPDFAFFSWPDLGVGTYTQHRQRTLKVEEDATWQGKINKLFWRGSLGVGVEDRKSMMAAVHGQPWDDVKEVNWDGRKGYVTMEDHCKWKFHAFPEGMTYSGRLKYLQNCRSIIITHQPHWIQHWTHLYNADPESPDQNIVYIPLVKHEEPEPLLDANGNPLKDERPKNAPPEINMETWARLPEVMEELIRDDNKAKRIADNQWSFFRERYISPAANACYWRKAIKIYHSVQQFNTSYIGNETAYESFLLFDKQLVGITV